MKFAHLADCHIGGWSDLKLKELNMKVFSKSIQECINRDVDFVLIAGDLFNTALPSIDLIKETVLHLKKLKDSEIPCYIIPGSHDYSPSGKTMLDVFENAGLVINVVKFNDNKLEFTEDKSGVKITGLFGKKAGLEKGYYELLDRNNLENEAGKKIFMFHTTLTEFKPEHLAMISSEPAAILPKGFDYYAGGHPHYIFNEIKEPYGRIVYPGALFPNNFGELERFEHGGFWINSFEDSEYVPIKLKSVKKYNIDLSGKDSNQVKDYILDKVENIDDCIVLLRLVGVLESGRLSDIDFKGLFDSLNSAFVVLKNTSALKIKEFEELEIEDNVEEEMVKKNTSSVELFNSLLESLDKEKLDGEKNSDFELRVLKDSLGVIGL
ncbi:DNA repair exonuclease [Candidatus Woesearchaeota archaeon]|jgi:hypothetical protein|nr:DNA repair exonuclease [Candidatus Woesearchaeota archaeon]MBT4835159.1 DNA repair exonuclease [Candidatus Woesearchaeota archaeon]MBT6735142.1 DNA repair exonuclease [Candidatus Woesearchaeota archaeon]MBT7170095.1 DNA repair exonuclease [Candidatus Woesearchaeota archaeon]MBT7474984.1 DNA repair exonuclease [Candidatus Woesearchaeota archaeon]